MGSSACNNKTAGFTSPVEMWSWIFTIVLVGKITLASYFSQKWTPYRLFMCVVKDVFHYKYILILSHNSICFYGNVTLQIIVFRFIFVTEYLAKNK